MRGDNLQELSDFHYQESVCPFPKTMYDIDIFFSVEITRTVKISLRQLT